MKLPEEVKQLVNELLETGVAINRRAARMIKSLYEQEPLEKSPMDSSGNE